MIHDLILVVRDIIIYINSDLNALAKFTSGSRSTEFKNIFPWNISNDHEDHPNQHKNSHKLCDEMKHPVGNLIESQWKQTMT